MAILKNKSSQIFLWYTPSQRWNSLLVVFGHQIGEPPAEIYLSTVTVLLVNSYTTIFTQPNHINFIFFDVAPNQYHIEFSDKFPSELTLLYFIKMCTLPVSYTHLTLPTKA